MIWFKVSRARVGRVLCVLLDSCCSNAAGLLPASAAAAPASLTTSSCCRSFTPLLSSCSFNCSQLLPAQDAYQCAPLLLRLWLLVLPLEALRRSTVSTLQDGDGARRERLGHGHRDGGQLQGQPLRPLPGGVEGQRRHLVAPISWLAVGGYAGNWQPPPVGLLAELPTPLSLNFTFTSAAGTAAQVVGSWRLPRSAVSAPATWPGLPVAPLGLTPDTAFLPAACSRDPPRRRLEAGAGQLGSGGRWFKEPLREAG